MVTKFTSAIKQAHTKHLDSIEVSGASIVWYGGIFLGAMGIIAGLIWILVLNQVIFWSMSLLYALIILGGGIGLIVFSIYLRKVIIAGIESSS